MRKKSNVTSEKSQEEKMIEREERLEENLEEKRELKEKHEIDMCSGPILKKMLLFAFPLMCSGVLQLLFNAADIIVVGRFAGDNSLAAVGSTSSLILLLSNLFIGLSIGANVLVARYFGARKERELSETVHTAVSLSIISGIVLAVLGILLAKPILHLMEAPSNVLDLSALYLRIYFLGMPAMMLYNFGSAILRAKGDTRRPLKYLTVAGVLNVCLNLFFVIELDMDVAGVATATAISQCVSAALIIRCLCKESGGFKLSFSRLKIHKSKLLTIVQIGLPAGFQGILFSLANVIIQSSINTFGDVTMAGSAASANIEGFVYIAMNAFYQSAISFTGQNMGAGKYDTLRAVCGGYRSRPWKPGVPLWASAFGNIFFQRSCSRRGAKTPCSDMHYLCSGRNYGRSGGSSQRNGIFGGAYDSLAGRRMRSENSMAQHCFSDGRVPYGYSHISVVSCHMVYNSRSTAFMLSVHNEE